MSKVFKLRDRFEWMKRQRVVKEAPFVPRFKRTRGRSRKRERERLVGRLFASFQNLSIPVKSSRLQLIRLNVLICENVIFFFSFFYASRVIHAFPAA